MENLYDVIIIGSGPAGLSAAIYAKRAKLSSLTIEANFASGGQVLNTYEVDNYPGLPGISGMDLGSTLRAHAEKMGAEFSRERVKELVLDEEIKIVRTRKNEYHAKTVILATGAEHRALNVPGEKELSGMGVSYCATCDGAFFKDKTVAVIGGGPAGLATAFFLTRAGVPVTIFEARDSLGGVVRHVIPEFRIASDDISHDAELCLAFGAKVQLNARVESIDELKAQGFTDVVVATGAWMPGSAGLGEGAELDVLEFLEAAKKGEKLELGEDVVVIGAGNTAMDAARVAKRLAGVKNVRLVYRRTKKQMPADEEELDLALADGVEFCELLAPKALNGAVLTCDVMELGEPDASGRRSPVATGETVELSATTVICMATALHTIAAGNMTPSYRVVDGVVRPVYFYSVDVSEFAVNKLRDRGSLSVRTIVTNVQDFVVNVCKGVL